MVMNLHYKKYQFCPRKKGNFCGGKLPFFPGAKLVLFVVLPTKGIVQIIDGPSRVHTVSDSINQPCTNVELLSKE
jgi:hypothetical protein